MLKNFIFFWKSGNFWKLFFGKKTTLLFSVFTALSILFLGILNDLSLFYSLIIIFSFLIIRSIYKLPLHFYQLFLCYIFTLGLFQTYFLLIKLSNSNIVTIFLNFILFILINYNCYLLSDFKNENKTKKFKLKTALFFYKNKKVERQQIYMTYEQYLLINDFCLKNNFKRSKFCLDCVLEKIEDSKK